MNLKDLEDMISRARKDAEEENLDISSYQIQTYRNCPENKIRVWHDKELIEILGTAKHEKQDNAFGF